jgi:hypothetical protein
VDIEREEELKTKLQSLIQARVDKKNEEIKEVQTRYKEIEIQAMAQIDRKYKH